MKVVLTSQGSTGDIIPMIALGRALIEAGHETRFAASTLFQNVIEDSGIPYVPVPPEWDTENGKDAMRALCRTDDQLKQLKQIYTFGLPYLDDYLDTLEEITKGADVLVSTYLYPFLKSLAEKNDCQFAVASFAHNVVPAYGIGPIPWLSFPWLPEPFGQSWRDLWWWISDLVVTRTLNSVYQHKLVERGLEPTKSFFREPAPLALVTVSQKLFAPDDGAVDPRFRYTGYWRYQTDPDPKQAAELEAFCAGQEVPVLNFGSVSFDDSAELFTRFLRAWPQGKKLIVQSGWVGFKESDAASRPEVKVIGQANHDLLFSHASVIIHHGGAGTTASALHSGKPQIIIPHIADQAFWAEQVKKLGSGLIGNRQNWPEALPLLVDGAEHDQQLRAKAEVLAKTLESEDGPATAVKILEEFVEPRTTANA
ncbi:MAG: glycosyltransferase [Verrucomicrobiota bacterium]